MAAQVGRPSPIDAVVGERDVRDDDGNVIGREPVTVADRVVALVRGGLPFELSCAAAGVARDTGYGWRRVAGRAAIRARGRSVDDLELTPHERRCVAFSADVERAEGEAAARDNAQIEQLARGGIAVTSTTTVEKKAVDESGNERVVERIVTTRTERTLPDAATLRWKLERRHPAFYGSRLTVRHEAVEHEPTEQEHASDLVESLEAYLAGTAEADAAKGNGKASGNGKAGR